MPIFEFRCEKCGKVFEKLSRMSEKKTQCPECGHEAEKILSLFNAIGTSPFSKCSSAETCSSAGKPSCCSGNCAMRGKF